MHTSEIYTYAKTYVESMLGNWFILQYLAEMFKRVTFAFFNNSNNSFTFYLNIYTWFGMKRYYEC